MLYAPTERLRAKIINMHLDGIRDGHIAYMLGVSRMMVIHVLREWEDGRNQGEHATD